MEGGVAHDNGGCERLSATDAGTTRTVLAPSSEMEAMLTTLPPLPPPPPLALRSMTGAQGCVQRNGPFRLLVSLALMKPLQLFITRSNSTNGVAKGRTSSPAAPG